MGVALVVVVGAMANKRSAVVLPVLSPISMLRTSQVSPSLIPKPALHAGAALSVGAVVWAEGVGQTEEARKGVDAAASMEDVGVEPSEAEGEAGGIGRRFVLLEILFL